jgi:hypothetical protein
MAEIIITLIIGLACIIIGILNTRGHISMMHSYHIKRVSEENRIPFGRQVGAGMIVIGATITVGGILMAIAERIQSTTLTVASTVIMIIGLIVGTGIAFSAMKKYNGGIF